MPCCQGVREEGGLRRTFAGFGTQLLFGAQALEMVARLPEVDTVMAGIVGAARLASTLAAVRAGKRVLLANKEALVMAGPLVLRSARQSGAQLVPVDESTTPYSSASREGVRPKDRAYRFGRPVPRRRAEAWPA